MLQPFLFVGVGGSGGKTLRAIKAELTDFIEVAGWDVRTQGFPAMWQFLHIDTPYLQDGEEFNARMLEPSEYLGIVNSGVSLDNILDNIEGKGFSPLLLEEVMSPLPRKGEHQKPVDQGASQYRAIGRTVAISKLTEIRDRVKISIVNMKNATPESRKLAQQLGASMSADFRPNILVISSLSGGSGSGQFMDVCEAIKAAEPSSAWVNSQTAILYAPDVFDDPKIKQKGGIAPNSLAAASELVNGRWRAKRTETTGELYKKFTFAEATGNTYNVGPRTVYLLGKSNGLATFSSQNDVYFAAAASLAKWATDSSITENIGHYLDNNAQASRDGAGLMVDLHHAAPMNSLGFARVSLGIDSFANFSAQRLARSAVASLVEGHLEGKKANENDHDAVKRKAEELRKAFLTELRLNPEVILNELQPESQRSDWRTRLSNGILARLAPPGIAPANRTAAEWNSNIQTAFRALEPSMAEEWKATSAKVHEQWVKDVQLRVVDVSTRYSANYGILVVTEMLRQVKSWLASYYSKNPLQALDDGLIQNALNAVLGAGEPGQIGVDADSVSRARTEASRAGLERQMNVSQALVKRLVDDLQANLLAPLIEELESMFGNLLAGTKEDDYAQTGENVYRSWPNGDNIPQRFVPAQNVRLLEPHTSFNAKFNELLGYSVKVEGAEKDAMRRAVEELVAGSEHIADLRVQVADQQGAEAANRAFWSMVEIESRWWPSVLAGKPQSRWRGKFIYKLEDWEDNAKKYVRMESRPLGKFIHTTLHQWLNPESDFERQNREKKLVAEFEAIIKLSKPFSELNPTLHAAAHGGAIPEFAVFISEIPAALDSQKSTLGQQLRDVLTNANLWDKSKESSFKGEISTSSIDIFSTLSQPVHHFVFDNLMKPINEGWKKAEGHASDRLAFMLRRQARTLPETVPLSPEILEGLLRGWYVAKLLGRVKEESGETGQGPRIYVFQEDPMNSGWDPLPYPLYFGKKVVPNDEYPAVVVASVGLALAKCSDEQSMKPFAPYRSLKLLGGPVTVGNVTRGEELEISEILSNWIIEGRPSTELSPVPNPKRAGDSSMSVEARKEAVNAFFRSELDSFERKVVNLAINKKHETLVWELRREVNSALKELIRMVDSIEETSSGT
jgi:hypothetical protein